MTPKKIINSPEDVVEEMIRGAVAAHSNIEGFGILCRADFVSFRGSGKVALISGGGSGHEPAHAGFIGEGMLAAAVLGGVFASPSPQQVYQAIKHVTGTSGCLLIVKNYTGDRLNFGIAQELARADGLQVEIVIVADDVALGEKAVRRGLVGTILVHKIAGALAATGATLEAVKQRAQAVIDSIGTMGVGLGPCTIPGLKKPGFELGENEIELGLGIHGEPGVCKQNLVPANELVNILLERLMKEFTLEQQTPVGILINGLGSTPLMELYVAAQHIEKQLAEEYKLNVKRIFVGEFMTAIDMPGFSITMVNLKNDKMLELLDAPTTAVAWPQNQAEREHPAFITVEDSTTKPSETLDESSTVYKCIKMICNLFIEKSELFTELDRAAGDGDMGISMERGARAVLQHLNEFPAHVPEAIRALALCLQQYTGGTSGVLYAIFFLKVSAVLSENSDSCGLLAWANAIESGSNGISNLGGAAKGDCTMLDALIPAVEAFNINSDSNITKAISAAASAARQGSDSTIGMVPKCGRGQYLGERVTEERDGGAEAIALIFQALADFFHSPK